MNEIKDGQTDEEVEERNKKKGKEKTLTNSDEMKS